MNNSTITLVVFLFLITFSCKKEKNIIFSGSVSGQVQKGPYLNGTSMTLFEMTADFKATGKSFSSQIIDNTGTFDFSGIDLISSFAELKSTGFYFDEVKNQTSDAQLTLFGLVDLNGDSKVNVNIISSLEKNRVEFLMSEGKDFASAKKIAQSEILAIFNMEQTSILNSENLDISKLGDGNAILLAISVIIQGYSSVGDLSQFISDLSSDLRADGTLTDEKLGTKLINNASKLNLYEIRKNLEMKYASMDIEVNIPNFEKFVNLFLKETTFNNKSFIHYPSSGKYGINILDPQLKEVASDEEVSMYAEVPAGESLEVRITSLDSRCVFGCYSQSSEWTIMESSWDSSGLYIQGFKSEHDADIKALIHKEQLEGTDSIYIDMFQNGSIEPTFSKAIWVK